MLTMYDSLQLFSLVRCSHGREHKIKELSGKRWKQNISQNTGMGIGLCSSATEKSSIQKKKWTRWATIHFKITL
jgi:hypothetical protein